MCGSGQLLHVAKRNAAIGWEHVQCSPRTCYILDLF